MTQKDFFAMLGAPLVNPRWSWGAVRESDGAVILRVWSDNVRIDNGREFVRLGRAPLPSDDPVTHGGRERAKHIELIRTGARCYLVMCDAVDQAVAPRRVKRFNTEEVFPGGAVQKFGHSWWVERRQGVPVAKFQLARTRHR